MFYGIIVLFVFEILLLIVVIYVSETKIQKIKFDVKTIPNFSTDVEFEEYPETINIENKYDCNADHLRVCLLDDPTTLFGCKELTVRCEHFDKDTPYHSNGIETTIPKNEKENEGYALSIISLADECSPFHGDMTLIAANNDSTDYMLVCVCKNPGFIGNDNILGNCTDVKICNGKIDNIDQPLEKINCVCDKIEINDRFENGTPYCRKILVHEANERFDGWADLVPWRSPYFIKTSTYNKTISSNLKTSILINPCSTSILDPTIGFASTKNYYNPVYKSCYTEDQNIPIRLGLFDSVESDNPSSDNSYTSPVLNFDAVLPTGDFQYIRFSDNVAGKRKFANVATTLPVYNPNETIYINLGDKIAFGKNQQIGINSDNRMISVDCDSHWPGYSCYMRDNPGLKRSNGLPIPLYREIPAGFETNYSGWYEVMDSGAFGLIYTSTGPIINQDKFAMNPGAMKTYGVLYVNKQYQIANKQESGLMSFQTYEEFKKHHQVVT